MNDLASPSVRAIDCPSCGGSIALQAAGLSTQFICQYCGSELDLVDPEIKLIQEHAEAGANLWIPIGSKGELFGRELAVIGYLQRSDGYESWNEYLLFNPYHGYYWLTHTAAGWSFGTPLMTAPASPYQATIYVDGEKFQQCFFYRDNKVTYALGEFYWRVQKGDEVGLIEFVGGGKMLSCEISGDEHNWTLERWVSSKEIANAFGVDDSGQYPKSGNAPQPHQPNPYKPAFNFMATTAGILFIAAIVFAIILEATGPRQRAEIQSGASPSSRTAELGPFTISGRPRPFEISTNGFPGDNNWLDVEYTLTNVATGDEVIANQPVEYYFGRNWKEDNRKGTLKLSSVPPGTYTLTAEVVRPEDERRAGTPAISGSAYGDPLMPVRTVVIKAGPGAIFWSNIFLLFLALFAPVFWAGALAMGFEAERKSDYDGNDEEDDDDDDW